MLRSNRPRLPADVFSIDDQVKCVNPRSKHYGHTAKVIGMGKTRLNVTFDNGHVGKFIDWRDATLVVRPNDHVSTTPTINTTSTTRSSFEDITNNLDQLTTLMEHLAFTSATVISSNYSLTKLFVPTHVTLPTQGNRQMITGTHLLTSCPDTRTFVSIYIFVSIPSRRGVTGLYPILSPE
jgi:hypothetical protein